MKKIGKLSLVLMALVIIACFMGNVYAALSCNIEMQSQKTQLDKNDEFTIDVKLSNIQSERGVVSLVATLDYDKDCLTLVKMEGQNGWATPIEGVSYNKANGKIVIDKNGLAKSDEVILKITFKVNDTNKNNTVVSLKDVSVADGSMPANINTVSKSFTIGDVLDLTPNPDENNTQLNNTLQNSIKNSIKDNNTIVGGTLPKAGNSSSSIIIISIIVVAVIGIVLYIKINKNKTK